MIDFLIGLTLTNLSIFATLIGLGKLRNPILWSGREEPLWIGRFGFLFGVLFLLSGLGIKPHTISEWLQDILTAGGGVGAG